MRVTIAASGVGDHVDAVMGHNKPIGPDILDAAYQTAHNYPGGVPALAPRMGVAAGTLMNKISVNNTTHHLTLKESVTMQEVTNNCAVLHAMAAALGHVCVRYVPASSDDPGELQWHLVDAFAELQRCIAEAMLAPSINKNIQRRTESAASDLISSINGFVGALRGRMPEPPESY